MPEWRELAAIAARPDLHTRPVAWRDGQYLMRDRFIADVRAWQAGFAAVAGGRVALYFEQAYDFAAALFGAWHAGKHVILPGDCQPVTLERLRPEVDAVAGQLAGAVQPGPDAGVELRALNLHSAELTVYTSGSSGQPVAVHKHLHQFDAELRALQTSFASLLAAEHPPRIFATVTHQHIYGLLIGILWPLAAGYPIVDRRLRYPEEMAAELGPAPSILVSSPAHLKRLPGNLDWSNAHRGVRAIFSSGGVLPSDAAEQCLELLGKSPIEIYGSSETGGIAWRQRSQHGEVWQPLPGVGWRFDDEVLAVRSPHLPDEQWYRTADRAQAGAADGFVLLGRADRIAKIEEKRISLSALEISLAALPEVREARALVLGAPGAQRLGMVVVPSEEGWQSLQRHGRRLFTAGLRAALLPGFERAALPRRWRYVAALPVNSQGKTTDAELTTLFRPYLPPLQWLEREVGTACVVLDVHADLIVFDGHFPATPVLPGVVQIDWAVDIGRRCFALPARFLRCEVLKFQHPVVPGTQLRLLVHWKPGSSTLSFRYSSDEIQHSSGRIVFEVDA